MDLEKLYKKAAKRKNSFVEKRIENTIHDICRNQKSKARKPTTALGGSDAFEGRGYLLEIIRNLIVIKAENDQRLQIKLAQIKAGSDISTLSSEEIVNLIVQHIKCKNSSRLPVLIVAAAYASVSQALKEAFLALRVAAQD